MLQVHFRETPRNRTQLGKFPRSGLLRMQMPVARVVLRRKHRTTCRTTNGVVRERDEAPVEDRVRTQATDRDRLAVTRIAIELGLRARVVVEVVEERSRRARQLELLRH